jgi:hypothetical protein
MSVERPGGKLRFLGGHAALDDVRAGALDDRDDRVQRLGLGLPQAVSLMMARMLPRSVMNSSRFSDTKLMPV